MHKGIDQIREAYRDDTVARSYIDERFRQPMGRLLHESQAAALRATVGRLTPAHVLEIAPGPARLTTEVAQVYGGHGVILDTSPQMLAEARRRLDLWPGASWSGVLGDAFALPFRNQFDLVYTFRLIRHFDDEDRARLYRSVASALRSGGYLVFDAVNKVVSEPVRARDPEGHQHYDALLTPDQLRAEIRASGLDLVALEGVQHRYGVLSKLQVLLAPRSETLAWHAMRLVDRLGGQPLEWIVTCRKR